MGLIQPAVGNAQLDPKGQRVGMIAKRLRLIDSFLILLVWLLANIAIAPTSTAADPMNRDSMKEAIAKIPFQELNEEARQKINSVLDKPSFFRRLPAESVNCDPELFLFLVRHPEVLVNIWEIMQITKVELQRVAAYEFKGNDGAGTTCQSELIYGTPHLHIYYGTGVYSGPLMARDVSGKCLCVLRSSPGEGKNGQPAIGSQMDIYMKLDNLGADLLTRTIAPVVGQTADSNFKETAFFISQLSQVCEVNPTAVQDMAQKLNKISPDVRQQFVQCAWQVALKKAKKEDFIEPLTKQPKPLKIIEEPGQSALRALEASPRVPEKPELIMKR